MALATPRMRARAVPVTSRWTPTAVMNPTYHDPMHLAEQLACVDNLSKGRFIFGAGVGYHDDYFKLFNVPRKHTGRRFQETLDVIEGAWTQERFSYDGEFFQYDDVLMTPKPDLLFDYSGFPPYTYQLTYPAPVAHELGKKVRKLLAEAGIESGEDTPRNYDHGIFVPLKVAFPDADIPILQQAKAEYAKLQ